MRDQRDETGEMLDLPTILKVISVSASGALAPGPLTASSAALGAKGGWRSGLRIAFGHTLVELPLVVILAYGLGAFFGTSWLRITLGFVGGLFLLFFACLTVRDALTIKALDQSKGTLKYDSPIVVGMALTFLNPYFIAWWVGVGSPLLVEALTTINILSLIVFYLAHVWLDYFWLMLVSTIGSISKKNLRIYRLVLFAIAIMILFFGGDMIATTLRNM